MLATLTPTEFVAFANQTLEAAYPIVEIEGEVLNFKISRGRWVYFDIADETSKLRCFCTVFMLPAPVEDGMRVKIVCSPRLHPQFGFSLNLQSMQFSGEGTIKKASDMLFQQLEKEGLFAPERKRPIPYPPEKIGLITSEESAAYRDFIKVLGARWGGMEIELADVQVQGESAPQQIVRAIEWLNRQAETADVLVIIRGGGSADDLQAFSSEQVTRAVAGSRIPTLAAIGHESDLSLAELAADQRASTPSNAAELLVPDRKESLIRLDRSRQELNDAGIGLLDNAVKAVSDSVSQLDTAAGRLLEARFSLLESVRRTLEALSPQAILRRGYAVVRHSGKVVVSAGGLNKRDRLDIQFADGSTEAEVK